MWWFDILLQHRRVVAALAVVVAVCLALCALDSGKVRAAMQQMAIADVTRSARPYGRRPPAGSGEDRCRAFIKRMTGLDFRRVRPAWLRNPQTGRALELDMFSAVPRPIAFEFDGQQHTRYTPFYHGTVRAFEEAQQRDRLKDRMCREHGVELVRIPAEAHDQPEAFVYEHLVRLRLVRAPAGFTPQPAGGGAAR